MIYVVGSGPSGVSCAYALVNKGLEVTMLDVGSDIEPETKNVVNQLEKSEHWSPLIIQKIKDKMHAGLDKGYIKYAYGSDYPYRDVNKYIKMQARGVSCLPSFGKGGLSAVWGASVMPYLDQDISDWPITIKDLEPHYGAVIKFMNIAAIKDDLSELFPLYTKNPQIFRLSNQAELLLTEFNRSKKQLREQGFLFGHSRLAVQFEKSQKKPGCVYCGLCMYGCPYGLIYNSVFTLEYLKKHKNFHYIKDVIVKKVKELGDNVKIVAQNRIEGDEKTYEGSRVFLGCGTLSTTKIMLTSMEAYNQDILIKDSQHFILPFLTYKGVGNVTKEKLHSLSQLYIELFDKKLSPYSIHLQIYTYNDLYEYDLKKRFGVFYNPLKKLFEKFMDRIIVMQGYIHSANSSSISVKLSNDPPNKLILRKRENKSANKIIKSLISKFFKNKKYFRMIPLLPLLKISKPGEGNHYGCSFPMKKKPKKFESDVLGRPYGFKRVHIVDVSVFPSIATQTITLTIMSNAHRIASMYDDKK